jgi:enoyl-CoA hydratase/carnithine racemase
MTGESIPALEALRIGLVDQVVHADDVVSTALELARTLADRAPYAVRTAKRLIDGGRDLSLEASLEVERREVSAMASPAERLAARRHAAAQSALYSRLLEGHLG